MADSNRPERIRTLGVLVPVDPGPLAPPEARPIGQAALRLREAGVEAVFGDRVEGGRIWGQVAEQGGWRPVDAVPVDAFYDRFPSQGRAARFAEILAGTGRIPLGNPVALTTLCRDKVASQRALEAAGVPMPGLEADPDAFAAALAAWGAAFHKPRFGSFGAGVRRVLPGDPLPAHAAGLQEGAPEPAILQQAISPPQGWAGICVRVLAQREPGGGWWLSPPAVRRSAVDPVVNAARGAEVAPPEVLSATTRAALDRHGLAAARALTALPGAEPLLELGLDLVIDAAGEPWLIEVNGRPRGRLAWLAAQDPQTWAAAHLEACCRPLRALASWHPGAWG